MDPERPDRAASSGELAAAEQRDSLVMVGNFDGVHRGHQWVLGRGLELAEQRGLQPIVLTFHQHPAVVLGRGQQPVLTPLERKVELLQRLSPRLRVVVEPFTKELASVSPREFASDLLQRKLAARRVTVGQNFRFGRGRAGDAAMLATLGAELGFEAGAEPLHEDTDGVISSTRIRDRISAGDVAGAERLLGRPHALSGVVEPGEQRARQLGIPSANLGQLAELLPARGVYAVLVDVFDEQSFDEQSFNEQGLDDRSAAAQAGGRYRRLAPGVANIGIRPTLGAGELKVEVHALGFSGDLYGRRLRAHFVARLRDETKFASLAELQARLDRDKVEAAELLAGRRPAPDAGGAWH